MGDGLGVSVWDGLAVVEGVGLSLAVGSEASDATGWKVLSAGLLEASDASGMSGGKVLPAELLEASDASGEGGGKVLPAELLAPTGLPEPDSVGGGEAAGDRVAAGVAPGEGSGGAWPGVQVYVFGS